MRELIPYFWRDPMGDCEETVMRTYISHCIMGQKGTAATDEEMAANCTRASRFGAELSEVLKNIDFYCPADHEDFVGRAYREKMLTLDQILHIDCEIVGTCEVLIAYCPERYISSGMKREILHAQSKNIHVIFATCLEDALQGLRVYLEGKKR